MARYVTSWPIAALPVALIASLPAFAQAPTPTLQGTVTAPAGLPPPVRLLSPDPHLGYKERVSTDMAAKWRNHPDKPIRDPDGTVRWVYGLSQPVIVCAVLHTCDLVLHPGEVVNNFVGGDTIRWSVTPVLSGMGTNRVTHLSIKPSDAGLRTNIAIYTTNHVYTIDLTSTEGKWTPKTGFIYPEDEDRKAWANYRAATGGGGGGMVGGASSGANLQFYSIKGDNPSWRPTHVYTDGAKTYIQFPSSMTYGEAPALLGLNNDGSLFHAASERTLIYRSAGNIWTVDGVENRLELVLGVGSSQTKVIMERQQ